MSMHTVASGMITRYLYNLLSSYVRSPEQRALSLLAIATEIIDIILGAKSILHLSVWVDWIMDDVPWVS